jgi:hypothetical protein
MGRVGWEHAMEREEVILPTMAKRITWWEAAEINSICDRPAVAGPVRRWGCWRQCSKSCGCTGRSI